MVSWYSCMLPMCSLWPSWLRSLRALAPQHTLSDSIAARWLRISTSNPLSPKGQSSSYLQLVREMLKSARQELIQDPLVALEEVKGKIKDAENKITVLEGKIKLLEDSITEAKATRSGKELARDKLYIADVSRLPHLEASLASYVTRRERLEAQAVAAAAIEGATCGGASAGPLPFRPIAPVHTFLVDNIPSHYLNIFLEKGSVHASSIINCSVVDERENRLAWIRENIVSTHPFDLEHDHSFPLGVSPTFNPAAFQDIGFKVWSVENDASMTCRAKFVQKNDPSKVFEISGRADFIITRPTTASGVVLTKSDVLNSALCIIVVQWKRGEMNIPACEVQLQLYLLLAMNLGGLQFLIGFLVQEDGMCRAFKATRQPGDIIYEQNDLVHVCHLPNAFQTLLE